MDLLQQPTQQRFALVGMMAIAQQPGESPPESHPVGQQALRQQFLQFFDSSINHAGAASIVKASRSGKRERVPVCHLTSPPAKVDCKVSRAARRIGSIIAWSDAVAKIINYHYGLRPVTMVSRNHLMKTPMKRFLIWTPRIFCLLFAVFLSIFALDVFDEHLGLWQTLLALLLHLVPTGLLLLVLAFSWRWAWVGGVLFTALGMFYLVAFWGRFHWSAYALISGPLFLLGALFLLNWKCRAKLHAGT